MLRKLAFGQNNHNVGNEFGLGRTKITRLVCKVLADKNKSYSRFINISSGAKLQQIMKGFSSVIKPPQIYGAIDCIHIKLAKKPKYAYKPNYMCRHDAHMILLQRICCHDRIS